MKSNISIHSDNEYVELMYFSEDIHVFSNQVGWYLSFNCIITEKCVYFDNDPSIQPD
jgi:hypothetical protein